MGVGGKDGLEDGKERRIFAEGVGRWGNLCGCSDHELALGRIRGEEGENVRGTGMKRLRIGKDILEEEGVSH